MLGFNDTSTPACHFLLFPREREKRDRRDEREGQGRKRNRNDLFVCVEVLRPSQPNGVMSRAVSLPIHTFTGQA